MIGGFRSILCVFVFQGSLLVIVIMIDGSEKRNWPLLNFRVRMFVKSAVNPAVLSASVSNGLSDSEKNISKAWRLDH